MITSAYKDFPALAVTSDSKLYASMVTDLDLSHKSAPIRCAIDAPIAALAKGALDASAVEAILAALPRGLLPTDFDQGELAAITSRAVTTAFTK